MRLRRRPTHTMRSALRTNDPPKLVRSIRLLMLMGASAGLLLGPAGVEAQAGSQTAARASSLPATPPTSLPNPNSLPAPIAGASWGGKTLQHHKARVTYRNGLLEVRADNSSLNQILRDISRETGMKIVGGVADQRIFGDYGPAAPTTMLQTLLEGTGANMLLKETATRKPAELVLTRRTGGSSPPAPNSPLYDATESEPALTLPSDSQPAAVAPPRAVAPQPARAVAAANSTTPSPSSPPSMPQPLNNVNGNPNNVSPTAGSLPGVHSIPLDSLPTPSSAPPVSGIVDAPNPPPAGSTTAGFTSLTPPDNNPNNPPATTPNGTTSTASPNPAKTPQQIYEELKQLQQKPPLTRQ